MGFCCEHQRILRPTVDIRGGPEQAVEHPAAEVPDEEMIERRQASLLGKLFPCAGSNLAVETAAVEDVAHPK